MAEQILKTIFQVKRGQSAAWASANPILRAGEPGFELDTGKLKIGNGIDAYNDLPYLNSEEIQDIQGLENSILELQGVIGNSADNSGLYGLINEKANAADVYTKDEVNSMVSSVYSYKGTVKVFAELPLKNQVGDVYNIELGDVEHGIMPGDNVAWNGTEWDKLSGTVDLNGYLTKKEFEENSLFFLTKEEAKATMPVKKYEFTNVPKGTLVDYRDKEIRVMCPVGTVFSDQQVGENGNPNMYYAAFKAYAPEGAVSFKEGDKGVIVDEMFTFEDDFAGIDKFGRKYSILWLALANKSGDKWNYFGKNSNNSKMIGWDYVVEWYDADGTMISTDQVRINLANESCYLNPEPYAMRNAVKEIKINGTSLDVVDNKVEINIKGIEQNAEGDFEIKEVNVNTLVQTEETVLIFDGGAI